MKVYSHSLQGKREANEDQHIHVLNMDNTDQTMNPVNFFAVFDGHGGKAVSKYLKDNLPQFFLNRFENVNIKLNFRQSKVSLFLLQVLSS